MLLVVSQLEPEAGTPSVYVDFHMSILTGIST